ncbi:hypothetical protein [Pseudobacteriovorax antillogorgiicola]|uniref:Uncharacterized protein n=1 Tax=Pseudobacteriovorax antillogorgiicola TaxID=1513793 RepID=A0A1Y6BM01_9BACT|nr:hypothetical protein [Pseudobacteriovorax antillogorgiicola]TCS54531.1 hypothetical protein EDD56_10644 [Pseudobacteriovorax antillogorgiicola]SMF18729.1 hypothetical protein SAMN06296036_106199 [Pseudobacteriovorax antillogorgiicola]
MKIVILILLGLTLSQCTKKNENQESQESLDAVLGDYQDDDKDFLDTGDAVRPADEEIDEVNPLNQCGFPDLSDTEALFFDQTLVYQYRRNFFGGLAHVYIDIDAKVRLGSSQVRSFFDFSLDVLGTGATDLVTGEVIADTSIVTTGASEQAEDFRGKVDSEAFPLRSNFDPEWKDILCTLPGSDYLVSTLGGYRTEVRFEPGYPAAMSPAADPERYDEEIGDFRAFTEIKATVISTNNPNLVEGKTYIGSVLVEKIEPKVTTPQGVAVESDRAYRMSYRFGTEEETRGLGLLIWAETYINHETREYSALKANMGSQSEINFFLPE